MHLPKNGGSSAVSIVLIVVILTGTALLAALNVNIAATDYRKSLQDRTATIAVSLDSQKVAQLKGQASDADTPIYRELKNRLALLKQSNTDARSIYLTGNNAGELFFYVDSEDPDTAYYSAPGEPYPEATDLFKGVFHSTAATVEGPLNDSYGNWVSGLAPVVDLNSGNVVAVVGIDIDADTYNRTLFQMGAIPMSIGFLFIGLIIFFEWLRRREQRQLRVRSELVSVASHELRTPITGIRWASESLMKRVTDQGSQTLVKAMHDSILNLQAGTEDILQLTRLTSNRDQKLQPVPTNMTKLIGEICDTQRLAAQGRNITVTMDKSWTPDVTMTCDPVKIRRALHNVVSNAIKYSKDGGTVTVRYEHSDKMHKIIVADQGIGIPVEEQSRVFAGFYRASNAKASVVEGTGLGLYLTKAILQQHHGRVTFVSEQGKGTTVTLELPVK